jgi:hypothetical protein
MPSTNFRVLHQGNYSAQQLCNLIVPQYHKALCCYESSFEWHACKVLMQKTSITQKQFIAKLFLTFTRMIIANEKIPPVS